jgi:hypothetical protein
MPNRPRLSELSPDDLLRRAAEYRRMATTARTADVQTSLLRLAETFERTAALRQGYPNTKGEEATN